MTLYNLHSQTGIPKADANFLLQTLLDHIPDIIYFKDRESRFILINKAGVRFFNFDSSDDAVGKTDFDIFTNEHALAAFADEQKILRTGVPVVGKEEKETWPDGTVTWAMTTKLPLRDSQGKIIGTFGISRDITERMHFIDQMAEQAALIDIAPDAIMVCDLQSEILFWNKGAEKIYGWTRNEAVGRNAGELLLPYKTPAPDSILDTVLNKGSWIGEVNHVTKDNDAIVVECRRTLVRDAAGWPRSMLTSLTPISRN